MELLAYIHEEFVYSDQAIASDDNLSSPFPIELTFQTWLQRITTKSAKLSLSVILASTTVFIGLGSTLNATTGVFTWSNPSPVGTYSFTIKPNDTMHDGVAQSVFITVSEPDPAPAPGGGDGGGGSLGAWDLLGMLALSLVAFMSFRRQSAKK